ncbi:MAG: restriction endonuclease subunit S [Aphanizomenon sp.]
MGNYQGYQKYKDSGVVWLGDIPEHWEQKRFKFSVNLINNKIEAENSNLSYMGLEHIESWTGKKIEDKNASSEGIGSHFLPNDVLFGKLRPYLAKVYLSDIEGLASTEALVLRCKNNIFPKFLKYYILSRDFINIVDSSTFGAKMPRASWDFIGNLFFIFPPLNEQEKIAQFLDYKTKQIDELIKKKETLIEKLDEKRTAIISHAVTKGLDSSVPIKDSGLEWLGDIPKHWEVKRLRYIGSCQNGISKGADYFGFGYPFVNYTDVYANIELPKTVSGLANSTDMDRINYSVQKGDIFFTRTSETIEEIGITSTCFNSINNATFSGFLIRVRPFPNLLFTGFSKYYFRCQLHRLFFVKEMNLVTRASLSQELLKRLPVLLPTIEEQKQISKHLDQKTAQIDQQKAKIKQAIELLKEYRTSLITNAVTGKIDVSQIAVP